MTPTLLAGASPFLHARPDLAKTSPTYPSGISMAMPVPTILVSPGAISVFSSIHAYKSAPAANGVP